MALFKKETKLFGNDIQPQCEYCNNGSTASDGEMVLCSKKGVVTKDFSCKKFEYNPFKRIPKRRRSLGSFTAEEFKL